MNLGLDFYDTISKNPSVYRLLADAVLDSGGKVYIISAIYRENYKQLVKDVKKTRVRSTEVIPVFYTEHFEVPKAKVLVCKELGIDLLVDDRLDVIHAVSLHGIIGLLAG